MRQHRAEFHTIIRLHSQTSLQTSLQTLQIGLLLDFIVVRCCRWLVDVVWCGVVWCVCEVPQITGAGCDEEEEGG